MTIPRPTPVLAAALALALGLGACGSSSDEPAAISDPGVTTASAPAAPATEPSSGDDAASSGSGVDDAEASEPSDGGATSGSAEPLAALDVETTDFQDEPVLLRLEVVELARGSSDTVRLDLRVANVGDVDFSVGTSFGSGPLDPSVGGLSLVDLAGNKRYLVLVDSEGDCVCTQLPGEDIPAGTERTYQATFPAPPADVTAVDVQTPEYGVLTDVPLADA